MSTPRPVAMRDALLARIHDAMATDPSVFLVTADFGSPVIDAIRRDHADRFVNVGIAEQNLINIAAGLALEGGTVFAYAIAPFITMRCLEQVRVSLCLLSQLRAMAVTLVGVGAGYSYAVSGPTHQCYEDISIMRSLPALQVLSPADHVTTAALFEACRAPGIRYLRLDAQPLPVLADAPPGASGLRCLRPGPARIALVATGFMTHTALAVADALAARGIGASLHDVVDLSGFDAGTLGAALDGAELVVTLEEGFTGRGGLDAVVQDRLRGRLPRLLPIGVPPAYGFALGTRAELHAAIGLDPATITARILDAGERR